MLSDSDAVRPAILELQDLAQHLHQSDRRPLVKVVVIVHEPLHAHARRVRLHEAGPHTLRLDGTDLAVGWVSLLGPVERLTQMVAGESERRQLTVLAVWWAPSPLQPGFTANLEAQAIENEANDKGWGIQINDSDEEMDTSSTAKRD